MTWARPVQMWAFCTVAIARGGNGRDRIPARVAVVAAGRAGLGSGCAAEHSPAKRVALPQVAVAPVTGQPAGQIQRDLRRQDVDAAIFFLGCA
jgi:hypothetical protein